MPDHDQAADENQRFIPPFVDFWNSYLRRVDEATRQLIESLDFTQPSPALSRERLDAVSQAMDVYLRSPEFLRSMRHTIDTIVAARTRQNHSRRQVDHGTTAKDSNCESAGLRDDATRHAAFDQTLHPQAADMWDRFTNVTDDSAANQVAQVGATAYDVVYTEGSLKLLRYRNECPVRRREPVLVCFSLINRPYILDLQPDRSVIRQLLRQGLDVYLIDWGIPTNADRTLRLHDYVFRRLKDAANFVCQDSQSRQLSLLGYCLGGTISAMYATLHRRQVRNLVLLATPIDFSGDESLLNLWTKEENLDVDALIDAFGNCPGSLLKVCFEQMKPVQNYVQKYMNLIDKKDDQTFLDNFFAMERWANDSIPVAGETFREIVKLLYQRNLLVKGLFLVGGRPIDLNRINCPLLILTADSDHLVPRRSALALNDYVSSQDSVSMSINAGHIGLAVSSKAHRQLWPKASTWIAEHSTSRNRTQT